MASSASGTSETSRTSATIGTILTVDAIAGHEAIDTIATILAWESFISSPAFAQRASITPGMSAPVLAMAQSVLAGPCALRCLSSSAAFAPRAFKTSDMSASILAMAQSALACCWAWKSFTFLSASPAVYTFFSLSFHFIFTLFSLSFHFLGRNGHGPERTAQLVRIEALHLRALAR